MKPETNLKVDIAHSSFISPVEAVQGDGGLRSISVELTDGGKPWYPPAGTDIAVAYVHSNGTKGLYNKLPDGRNAVTLRNNIVTVFLAPQMLAAAGEVKAAIVFSNEKLDQLTTFPITITVRKNLFADAEETVDYIRLQWLEDKLDEYLKKAKDSGVFDGPKGEPFTYADFTPEQLAALTGPQGPAGDNTAALEAAQMANAAAENANTAATAAQGAADTVAADINQVKDNFNSLEKLLFSPVSSGNYSWKLGYTVSSSGSYGPNKTTSATAVFSCKGGMLIANNCSPVGMNDKETYLFVVEYTGQVFKKRTRLPSKSLMQTDKETDAIRFVFGYQASSGNTPTQEDIDAFFAVSFPSSISKNAYMLDTTEYTPISSNISLNDIVIPGTYTASTAVAKTLSDCPVAEAFKLTVENIANKNTIRQTIKNALGTPNSIARNGHLVKGNWSKWVKKQEFQSNVSCDHLYLIDIDDVVSVEKCLKLDGGEIVEGSDEYRFTDYLPCPKYIIFNAKTNDDRIVVYFYSKEGDTFIPRWDILDLTTSTMVKNYFGKNAYNKVIPVPENVYMRIARASGTEMEVYGWDGVHIGCPMVSTVETINTTTLADIPYNSNVVGLTLPGNTRMVFAKDCLLIHVFGLKNGTVEMIEKKLYYHCYSLPSGYDCFRLTIALNTPAVNHAYSNASYEHVTSGIDISDSVSAVVDYTGVGVPYGNAENIIKWADYVCRIPWTCLEGVKWNSHNYYFKTGEKYTGIPYSSEWTKAWFFGWHCSKHTFLNAANDKDSKFYKERSRTGYSFGYGTVCSAFATLVSGWPYPQVTDGLLTDPQIVWTISNQPVVGSMMYNNNGHTLIPAFFGGGENYKMLAQYEGANPTSSLRMETNLKLKNPRIPYGNINEYVFSCYHRNAVGHPNAYDIEHGEITNGHARPYVGDRGVFTSTMNVQINLKDELASTLYLQKCNYNESTRIFTPTGAPYSIPIQSGQTSVVIDKSLLENNAFYGVYTNTSEKMEYFEYHIVDTETYRMTDDNFTFSRNDFWYAIWWKDVTASGNPEIVPCMANGDYSGYRADRNPNGGMGTMFFKGVLGAYCVPLRHE